MTSGCVFTDSRHAVLDPTGYRVSMPIWALFLNVNGSEHYSPDDTNGGIILLEWKTSDCCSVQK